MGLGMSREADPDTDAALDGVVNREYGFRVHRVEEGSPGADAGLQSILDYIVVANGPPGAVHSPRLPGPCNRATRKPSACTACRSTA